MAEAYSDSMGGSSLSLGPVGNTSLRVANHVELIEVDSDRFAIETWLKSYSQRSAHTVRSFRKEAERFLLWLDATKGSDPRHLPSVGVEEVNGYVDFMVAPRHFSDELLRRHGRTTQPFRGPLDRPSLRQAIVILHRMFEALRNVRGPGGLAFIQFNPWVLARSLSTDEEDDEIEQALSDAEWSVVQEVIEGLPQRTSRELAHYHRTRWVFQLLYRAWLRREEAVQLRMGHFVNAKGGWSIKVTGKGRKKSTIVATTKLMSELVLYRRSLGLSDYPGVGEDRPVILPVIGKEQPVSAQTVYLLCCSVFRDAALVMSQRGDEQSAARLMQATPHWLRHTGISHAMDREVDPRFVQAQARHSSLKTTAKYDHKGRTLWRDQLEQRT